MSEKRKRFPLYLTDEEMAIVKERAAKTGMSPNEYIRQRTLGKIDAKTEYNNLDCSKGRYHHFKLKLDDEDYQTLKLRSAESGISMMSYLRYCIRMKKLEFYDITIKHHDLDKHTEIIGQLTRKVTSVCNTITHSQRAYPQEVERLMQWLEKINDENVRIIDVVYQDRRKINNMIRRNLAKNMRYPVDPHDYDWYTRF